MGRQGFRQLLRPRVSTAALLLALLTACDDAVDVDASMARAEQQLAAGEVASAEVALRSLLQQRPESWPARLLLGRTLIASGNWGAAEAELRRAEQLGGAPDAVLVAWSELQLAMGRAAQVVDRHRARPAGGPSASPALLTQVALAHQAQGAFDAAEALLVEALTRDPAHVGARVARAQALAWRGDVAGARRAALALTAEAPGSAAAWVLLGDVLSPSGGDAQAAADAYERALAAAPRQVGAHAGLIRLALQQGRRDLFAARVAALRKALPGDPTGLYYDALLAEREGDLARARERLQPLLRAGSSDPELLMLTGVVESRLGNLEQAELALSRVVTARPTRPEPRIELARLYLRTARTEGALRVLAPLLGPGSSDATALGLAGQAHTLDGNYKAADAAFSQAGRLRPGDARLRTAHGRSLLARGELDKGQQVLQSAAAADDHDVEADLQLVALHMRKPDRAAALEVIEAMAAKPGREPLAAHVQGRVLEATGDADGARAAYTRAVNAQPRFLAAVSSLAQWDLAAGQLDQARARYEAYLKLEPRSAVALLAMAVITRREGASRAQAAAWIDKAVAADPRDAGIWLQAIDLHRQDQDLAGALARAQAAAAALPDDPDLTTELAVAQMSAGDLEQAIANLTRVTSARPGSAVALLRLAEAHARAGRLERGAEFVEQALQAAPDWPPALRAGIALWQSRGLWDRGLALARAVQKRRPKDALGFQLEGELESARRQWPKAESALRKALERNAGSTELAIQLHEVLRSSGDRVAAQRWQAGWLERRPGDSGFVLHLAQAAERDGDDPAALEHYRSALRLRGGDAAVMNNLAMVLVRLKDPQALAMAQQAARLAPNAPQVLDTLAHAYALTGDADKAIGSQRQAVDAVPHDPAYRWRLAQIYARARQPDKARAELLRIRDSGQPFAEREQAEQLLRQLGG